MQLATSAPVAVDRMFHRRSAPTFRWPRAGLNVSVAGRTIVQSQALSPNKRYLYLLVGYHFVDTLIPKLSKSLFRASP